MFGVFGVLVAGLGLDLVSSNESDSANETDSADNLKDAGDDALYNFFSDLPPVTSLIDDDGVPVTADLAAVDPFDNDAVTDEFANGTWVTPGTPATIQDFNAAEDELVVIYDENTTHSLDITVTPSDTSDAIVSLNGQAIMQVVGGSGVVTPDMVRLVAETST